MLHTDPLWQPAPHTFSGINGQPYIDLEPYLDLSGLDAVTDEVTRFLATNRDLDIISYSRVQELTPYYYMQGFDPQRLPLPRDRENLDRNGNLILNSFFEPVLLFQQMADIRALKEKNPSHLEYFDKSRWTTVAEKLPVTVEFVKQLPLKEFGRVSLYHTRPDQECPAHKDYRDEIKYPLQFIYFNPLRKPFFVLDAEARHVLVESRAAYFNVCDFHGVQRSYKSGFSIRVNGLWSDELIDATGLREYFAQGREHRPN